MKVNFNIANNYIINVSNKFNYILKYWGTTSVGAFDCLKAVRIG